MLLNGLFSRSLSRGVQSGACSMKNSRVYAMASAAPRTDLKDSTVGSKRLVSLEVWFLGVRDYLLWHLI